MVGLNRMLEFQWEPANSFSNEGFGRHHVFKKTLLKNVLIATPLPLCTSVRLGRGFCYGLPPTLHYFPYVVL